MLAAHFHFCTLFSLYLTEIGVYTLLLYLLGKSIKGVLGKFFL